MGGVFLRLQLPECFVLEVSDGCGGWVDHGLYRADAFIEHEDGTLSCVPESGSPLYLRAIRRDGAVIDVLDGGGARFSYRLVPFPGGGYAPSR